MDEAHYAKDWGIHLKGPLRFLSGKLVIASDSSSLVLRQGIADTVRRFSGVQIPLMSLREYIFLRAEHFCLAEPISGSSAVKETVNGTNVLATFEEYLERGIQAVLHEWDFREQIEHSIEKTLHGDVPFFVPQISDIHFRLMNAVVGFLAISKYQH